MLNYIVSRFWDLLGYVFSRRTSVPSAAEVAGMRVGEGVVLADPIRWWVKLWPGSTLSQVYPATGTGDGIPRVTTAQRVARPPVLHDLVFDIDLDRIMAFDGTVWGEV